MTDPSATRRRGSASGAILLLLLLPAIVVGPALFTDAEFVPFSHATFEPFSAGIDPARVEALRARANHDVTEKTLVAEQEYLLAREELAAGRLPLWDPWVRGGAPLLANALDGFAYPPHWLMLLLGPRPAFAWIALIGLATAGLLTFGLLRALGLATLPALFGAVTFQLSSTLMANTHFFMRLDALIWLPGGLWALVLLERRSGFARLPSLLAAAACCAMAWTAGFPPFALTASLAWAGYAGWRTLGRLRRDPAGALGFAGFAAGAWALGLALAAIQLLPMLDYFPHSQRDLEPPPELSEAGGMDPVGWLGLLLPAPFGSPAESSVLPYDRNPLLYLLGTRTHAESGDLLPVAYNFTEYALYLGALPLLALLAAAVGRRRPFRGFAFTATALLLVLATGGSLLRAAALLLPPLAATPAMRLAGGVALFGSALAAIGLEGVGEATNRGRLRWIAGVGLVLAALALLTSARLSELAARPAIATELSQTLARRWQPTYAERATPTAAEALVGRQVVPALTHLSAQLRRGAFVFGLGGLWFAVAASCRPRALRGLQFAAVGLTAVELLSIGLPLNPSFPPLPRPDPPIVRFLRAERAARAAEGGFTVARVATGGGLPSALPPDLLVPERIRDLNAYAFLDARSQLPFARLYGDAQVIAAGASLHSFPPDRRLDLPLFDLLGVRFLIGAEVLPGRSPVFAPPDGDSRALYVYERSTALPRAFLAAGGRQAGDEEALARITAEDFDPRREVLLAPGTLPPPAGEPGELGPVRFLRDDPTDLLLDVPSSPGAWLVLTDTAFPHWSAHLDGEPTVWWRADLAFRAVWVPAGSHQVRFVYAPPPFDRGLTITLLATALVLAAGLVRTGSRRWRLRSSAP